MLKRKAHIELANQKKIWFRNLSLSIFFHLAMFVALIYFHMMGSNEPKINSVYFTIDTKESVINKFEDNLRSDTKKLETDKPDTDKDKAETDQNFQSVEFSDIDTDTTNLDQLYLEKTLNVSIKYPRGWIFIDQNRKGKLDGVTFWANDGTYKPPPYIHLEVVERDLFIQNRFQFKVLSENYNIYYNNPEEMQGYFTQIFFLRTDEDYDFRIKLMIKGEMEYNSFLPRFWAILKSFDFGHSLF